MTATEIKLVSDSGEAKTWKTAGRAFTAAKKIAAALGTGANPLGASGAGNVAVGSRGKGEFVICVRSPGRTTKSGWIIDWKHEWVA